MTDDAESGKGRRGLFGALGRLFGGSRRDDAYPDATRPEFVRDNAPGPAEAARWTGRPAPIGDQADANDEDDEEALVLGPSRKAPEEDGTGGGLEAPEAPEAPEALDDDEGALTLFADIRAASGEESDAWAGDASLAEGGTDTADDLLVAEDFLARLRAAAADRDRDGAPEDASATGSADGAPGDDAGPEDDGLRDEGPGDDGPQDAGGAEELSDEEALVARLRAMGAEQWSGFGGSDENDETPPGDAGAGEANPAEAAPMPQEGHMSGFSWLSGEEREDGEGTTPASDAGPDGRETMEAEEMGREDEIETDDDAQTPDTQIPEAEAPGAVLFPGAMGAAGATGREDEPEEADAEAGSDGAEETVEAAAQESADAEAGDEETPDATPDDESGDATAGPATSFMAVLANNAERGTGDDAAAETASGGEDGSEDGSEDGGEDAGEAKVLGILAASSEEPGEAAASEASGESAGADAAAFEESVRRLIREELEGEMGERLSRNIRNMIREEVAHALLRNR